MKSNGDIYINGEKIDYLTLNGRDFFKGDNKVMLDNLPYFSVKDLKVYRKKSDKDKRRSLYNNFRWRKPYYIDTRLDFRYDDSKTHSLKLDCG